MTDHPWVTRKIGPGAVRLLTIVSVALMSPTWLAEICGMNFAHLPILQQPWAYPLVLTIMGCMFLGSLLYFSRKGWFA